MYMCICVYVLMYIYIHIYIHIYIDICIYIPNLHEVYVFNSVASTTLDMKFSLIKTDDGGRFNEVSVYWIKLS
jgi:hypothetical protein